MNPKKLSLAILLLAISQMSVFATFAHALTPSEIKSAIDQKMRERHPVPDPNFWNNLGPESVPVMEEMLKTSNSPLEQSWVIDGLSHFNDPSIAQVLESSIQASNNGVLKKKMLDALVDSQGETSFDFVEPYLKDKDPHVRLAVATHLQNKMSDSPKIQARLVAFNADEKQAWVKKDFAKNAETGSSIEKRENNVYGDSIPLKRLAEKDWAGEWSGLWITPLKSSPAKLTLTRLEKEKSWKSELKIQKMNAFELKRDGTDVIYYTSSHLHWLEVRSQKDDSVFIGQRKP